MWKPLASVKPLIDFGIFKLKGPFTRIQGLTENAHFWNRTRKSLNEAVFKKIPVYTITLDPLKTM